MLKRYCSGSEAQRSPSLTGMCCRTLGWFPSPGLSVFICTMEPSVAPYHSLGLMSLQSACLQADWPWSPATSAESQMAIPPRSWFCGPLIQPVPRFCLDHLLTVLLPLPDCTQTHRHPSSRSCQPRGPSPHSPTAATLT